MRFPWKSTAIFFAIIIGIVFIFTACSAFMGESPEEIYLKENGGMGSVPTDASLLPAMADRTGTLNSGQADWYYFQAVPGKSYSVSWIESSYVNIKVSAYRGSKNGTALFSLTTTSPAQPFTVTSDAYVLIKVEGVYSYTSGSYTIRYDSFDITGGGSVPADATLLTDMTDHDGYLISGQADWYYFQAEPGKSYSVSWTETYSANIKVSAYSGNKNGTALFSADNTSPADLISVTSASNIYIKVESTYSYSNTSGSYTIKYESFEDGGSGGALTSGVWRPGVLTNSAPEQWYSFSASPEYTYTVSWEDSYTNSSSFTVDIKVSAYEGTQTGPAKFSGVDSGPKDFTVTQDTTIHVKVVPYHSNITGTYRIKYEADELPPPTLNTSSSFNDTYAASGNLTSTVRGQWYQFTPLSGYINKVYWMDYTSVNVSEYADVQVVAYSGSKTGSPIFSLTDENHQTKPVSFPSSSTTPVFLKVEGVSTSQGMYRIRRESLYPSSLYTSLSNGTLQAGGEAWYRFSVSSSWVGPYTVSWEDSDNSSSCTANIKVSIYTGSTPPPAELSGIDSDGTASFTVNQSGDLYVKVEGYNSSSSGTYRIKYTAPGY
ncbi:MAG: hypothetical protein LBQ88_22665 [Treponema sp.]|jgi:hypothetical protein|nr:hypothetical protein [Treponema sp.]